MTSNTAKVASSYTVADSVMTAASGSFCGAWCRVSSCAGACSCSHTAPFLPELKQRFQRPVGIGGVGGRSWIGQEGCEDECELFEGCPGSPEGIMHTSCDPSGNVLKRRWTLLNGGMRFMLGRVLENEIPKSANVRSLIGHEGEWQGACSRLKLRRKGLTVACALKRRAWAGLIMVRKGVTGTALVRNI